MQFDGMVAMALRSNDELFHVHLYNWFRSVELTDNLIKAGSLLVASTVDD